MPERPPLDRSVPLRGVDLRHALLVILGHRQVTSVGDALQDLERAGFRVAGPNPRKTVSDAFRREVIRGRARNVGWGRYKAGRIPPTTAWRARNRWRNTRPTGDSTLRM